MSRRLQKIKPRLTKDLKYNSILIGKFINIIMKQGKKSTSEKIIYGAFNFIKTSTQTNPLKIFNQAIEKTKPLVEVRPRRIGGATYQVPIEIKHERSLALSLKWIKISAKSRAEKTMPLKLAHELIDASKNKGEAIKKKENMHKMAEANKAFAHYLW